MTRLTCFFVLLLGALVASCGGSGSSPTTVTVLGYTVVIKTAPPASALVGSSVPIAFTVTTQESDGTSLPASGKSFTAAVTAGGGTAGGASSVTLTTAADGSVATMWVLGTTAGTQTLRGSVSASQYLDISMTATALPATQLAMTTQPAATATVGVALTRQPVVQAKDANGANVALSGIGVVASIASGNGTLAGTTTVNTDANGLATFTDLLLNGVAGTVTLKFTATLNGSSTSVTSSGIALTLPNQLAISAAPTSAPGNGVPVFTEPVVQLQDGSGAALHQSGVPVTVSVASGTSTIAAATGGIGNLTVNTDANGVATFHDLALTGAVGTMTLRFASPGLASVITGAIALVAAPIVTTLANGVPLGPFVANAGDMGYFTFAVPAGTLSMDLATTGGSGSIDLYIRHGLNPTATDFDCHANVAGPSQICNFSTNLSGQYFAIVKATSAYSGSNIRVNAYNAGCTPKGTLTFGNQIHGTLSPATGCLVDLTQQLNDRYTFVLATTQAIAFTASATSDVNYIFLAWKLPDVGESFYSQGIGTVPLTTSTLLWAPGTYTVLVADGAGTQVPRDYTVAVNTATAQPVGCNFIQAYGAVTATLALTNSDCAGTTASTHSHRVAVNVPFGQTITVNMSSTAFDPLVKLLSGFSTTTATIMAQDDNGGGGTSARLVFTNTNAASDGSFTVELTSALAGALGQYTFSITNSPANYDLKAMARAQIRAPGAQP